MIVAFPANTHLLVYRDVNKNANTITKMSKDVDFILISLCPKTVSITYGPRREKPYLRGFLQVRQNPISSTKHVIARRMIFCTKQA